MIRSLFFNKRAALPEDALIDIITQVQALDMEMIRKEIAEQQSSQNQ